MVVGERRYRTVAARCRNTFCGAIRVGIAGESTLSEGA